MNVSTTGFPRWLLPFVYVAHLVTKALWCSWRGHTGEGFICWRCGEMDWK